MEKNCLRTWNRNQRKAKMGRTTKQRGALELEVVERLGGNKKRGKQQETRQDMDSIHKCGLESCCLS